MKRKLCIMLTLFMLVFSMAVEASAVTCNHEFGPWRTTKQATCTSYGSKVHTCKKCGQNWYATIAPKGHSWKRKTIRSRTCTQKGLFRYTCTRCGKKKMETWSSLGHHYATYKNSGKSRKQSGKTQYYWELCCTRCGKKAGYGNVWTATKPKDK